MKSSFPYEFTPEKKKTPEENIENKKESAILKEGYEKENKESIDEKKMVKRRKKISEVKIEEEHEELIPKRKRKTSGGKTSESDEPSIKRCMNSGYTEMMNRNNSSPPRGINKFEVSIWPCNLVHPYLNIPAKFRAANGLTEYNSLTLMDPKGRSWQVQLRHKTNKFESRTSMTTGWNKFASANELKQGDKCIFELGSEENNGILLMKVSIKKKESIDKKKMKEKKKMSGVKFGGEHAILKVGYEKENKESIDEKKMVKRRKKISEVKIEEEHEELIPKRKRKTSGGKTSESDEPSIKRCMNSGYTEMMNRNNSSPPRGINKFEAPIWPCNLVHPYLNIPAKFRAANGLTEYNSLTLMDPKGRSWQVQLRHKTNKFESRTSMTTGWNKFACANELKQGDKCIFELGSEENNGILLMKVSIKKKESIDKKKMKEKKKMSGVKFGGEHVL
ncbi:B3 domain-containing protein Os03g0622100-like [Asparagus officinalis]|uniref:B3 domain-containing protein Os03g0622100-like n=1 Tax=Asparagus officinalis TaxID=4686 RepID=UPI00098E7C3C|nr:B3 domain-containing protein Os03g0622100-like [Asparagus officinalis]